MALVSAGLAPPTRSKPGPPQHVEVVRVDLRNYGWRKHSIYPGKGEAENPDLPLAIDGEDRVLTGVTVRVGPGLPTRGNTALSFHILRFNADGKLDLTLPVPANSWRGNLVYVDAADDVIAHANDRVQVLPAKDEDQAQRANWKTLAAPCGQWCAILESHSRQTFLLFTPLTGPPSTVLVLGGSPLHLEMTCQAAPLDPDAITNAFTYSSVGKLRNPKNIPWGLATYYRWPLCDYSRVTKLGVPDSAPGITPLSDQSLFAWVTLTTGAVYSPDGRVKRTMLTPLAKHENSGVPHFSADGSRMAMIAQTWVGGSWIFDISAHVAARRVIVYDMVTGTVLASIPLPIHYDFFDTAISPDGHVVAAIEGPQLYITRVP